MNPLAMTDRSRHPRLAALTAAALLLFATGPVLAQDGDDDGVLPVSGGTGGSGGSESDLAPAYVGLSGTPGTDVLDPFAARVMLAHADGLLFVETGVSPEEATFAATGAFACAITDTSLALQGPGQLVLPAGLEVRLQAAPSALVRLAFAVVHDAHADLGALLAGAQAPSLVLALGDVGELDLAKAQDVVCAHAADLAGQHVSLVFVALDAQGQLHLDAARLDPAASAVELLSD